MIVVVDRRGQFGLDCEPARDRLRAGAEASEHRSAKRNSGGDLILLEVLQGARDDGHAARIEGHMRQFQIARMFDDALVPQATCHYRFFRQRAIAVRKTIDVIIATFCIAGVHVLLHDDRDFAPFVTHLGLNVF